MLAWGRTHWRPLAAGVAAVAVGITVYLVFIRTPGDVSHPRLGYHPRSVPDAKPKQPPERFRWPFYGYTVQRTRYLEAKGLRPPFRRLWVRKTGHALLEFQPVMANGSLFLVDNNGRALALSAKTGNRRWVRRIGYLNASSPAWWRGRVYTVPLSGVRSKRLYQNVHLSCLDARTGRVLWTRRLSSGGESGPIVVRGRLYFGTEDGTVHAFDARSGRSLWTAHVAGPVKAGVAYSNGRLFVADYAGEMTALRASNGRQVWNTGTQGRSFSRSGTFYSTPAVAFGRVYAGNTDGKVYAFVAATGQLAWSHTTGNYVYASPAVATVPGTPPTVYVGSYDGTFYALDARSGSVRWSYSSGGRISGAASVIGRIVYFSSLGATNTVGLDVRTGRRVFKMGDGAFTAAISDTKRLYLTGYNHEYAFVPAHRGRP